MTKTSEALPVRTLAGACLQGDPQELVLALAAGAVSVEQAVARASLQGDPQELAAVFGTADAPPAPGRTSADSGNHPGSVEAGDASLQRG